MAVHLGPKRNKLIGANKDEQVYDAIRSRDRALDQLIHQNVITRITTNAAPPGSPANGDAYMIMAGTTPTGAWTGWAGRVAVWTTDSFLSNSNVPHPEWEYYTPKNGDSIYVTDESTRYKWDGSQFVLDTTSNQKTNTDSDTVFGSTTTPLLTCTDVDTMEVGSYRITKAQPITDIFTPPMAPSDFNQRYEQLFSFTLTANSTFDAFYIFSNTNTYTVYFSTGSNHEQYQRSKIEHLGEHGWGGSTVEHINVETTSAGFFIDDSSNDPVVTFSATNASNHSTFSFHSLLNFDINCTAYLVIDSTPGNP